MIKIKQLKDDYKDLEIGDLLYNPFAEDLWIVSERFNEEKQEDELFLVLVHSDYCEDLDIAASFIRIGNVYDYAEEVFEKTLCT